MHNHKRLSIQQIDTSTSVINPDYNGSIKVLLINNNNYSFQVAKETQMTQLIIEKISTQDLVQTKELPDSKKEGFDSTGLRTTTLQSELIEENGAKVQPEQFDIFQI